MSYEHNASWNQRSNGEHEGFKQGFEAQLNQRMYDGAYSGEQGGSQFAGRGGRFAGGQFQQADFLDCNEDFGGGGFGERGSRGRMHSRRRELEFEEFERWRHMHKRHMRGGNETELDGAPVAYDNSLLNGAAGVNPDYYTASGQSQATTPDYYTASGPGQATPVDYSNGATVQNQTGDGTQQQPVDSSQLDSSLPASASASFTDQNGVLPPGGTDAQNQQGIDPVLAQILQDAQQKMTPDGFNKLIQQLQTSLASGQQVDDVTLLEQTLASLQQAGVSTADLSALQTVAQTDLTNAQQGSDQQGSTPTQTATTLNGAGNGDGTGTGTVAGSGNSTDTSTVANNGNGTGAASGPTVDQTIVQIAQDAGANMTQDGLNAFVTQLQTDLNAPNAQQLDDVALMQKVLGELQQSGMSQPDLTALQTAAQKDLASAQSTQSAGNTDTSTAPASPTSAS